MKPEPTETAGRDTPARAGAGSWRALLVAVMLVGAAIRAAPIVDRPLWFDEVATWSAAQAGLNELLRWQHHPDHPPLSYLLVRGSMMLFQSDAEWVLRLPSLAAGLLCLPAAYLLGRLVHGPAMGGLLMALTAFDPNLVDQSQQARMYSLFMLVLLVLLAWLVWMHRSGRMRSAWAWAGVGGLLAALFWTSQFAPLVWLAVLAGALGHAWQARRRDGAVAGREVMAGLALAYAMAVGWCLIGLAMLAKRVLGGGEGGAGAATAAAETAQALNGLFGPTWVTWPALLVAAVGLWRLSRRQPMLVAVLVTLAGANLVAAVATREAHHLMASRYLMAVLPAAWVGLAWSAVELAAWMERRGRLPRVAWAPAVLALACLAVLSAQALVWHTPPRYRLGEQLLLLRERRGPGDQLAFYPEWTWRVAYYNGLIDGRPTEGPLQPGEVELAAGARLWLVVSFLDDEQAVSEARRWVSSMSQRLGSRVDAAALDEHLLRRPAFVVGLGEERAVFLAAPENDGAWLARWQGDG